MQKIFSLLLCFSFIHSSAQDFFKEGDKAARKQNFDEAAQLYLQVKEGDPNYPRAIFNAAWCYYELKKYNVCIEYASKAIGLAPKEAPPYFKRAQAKAAQENYTSAIDDYTRSIELDPKGFSYHNRAGCKEALGDYQGALEDYTKSCELDPRDADSFASRAYMKVKLNDLDGAVADFTKAIKLDHKNPDHYFYRAEALLLLKRFTQAISDYNKAVELDPKNPDFYFGRAAAFSILDREALAISDYNKAIELGSKNQDYYFGRAGALSRMKHYAEAISDYASGLKLGPENSSVLLDLSELYLVTGEYAQAKAQLVDKVFVRNEQCIGYFLQCVADRLLQLDTHDDEINLDKALRGDFELPWSFNLMKEFIESGKVSAGDKIYIGELIKKVEAKHSRE